MVQINRAFADTRQGCVHHWLCGDQRNSVVHAICVKCSMETDFVQELYPKRLDLKGLRKAPSVSHLFD